MTNPAARRILIVEDDAIIAADLANKVQRLGYVVAGSVMTGAEAVAAITQQAPALVLMDINLHDGMDGIAAAIAIRQTCQVPVIFLSGSSDRATIARASQVGNCRSVMKPFDNAELRCQIAQALAGTAVSSAPAALL